MTKIQIPEETKELIDSVNAKIDEIELDFIEIRNVYRAYINHIVGDSDFRSAKKKGDVESFYVELTDIFGFSDKELEFLKTDGSNGLEAAFGVTRRVLEKDPIWSSELNEIYNYERAVGYLEDMGYISQ